MTTIAPKKTLRNELRILEQNRYTINNILQPYMPLWPLANNNIELDGTPIIGYQDQIDKHECVFRIYRPVITADEKTALYNKFIGCVS